MPGFAFKRSTGAEGDRKELEYVIALHQTCLPDTRENATVSSSDIAALLLSRHALRITHADALNVVRSFGAGDTRVVGHGGKRLPPSSSPSAAAASPQPTPKKALFGRGNGILRTDHPSPNEMKSDDAKPTAQNRPPATSCAADEAGEEEAGEDEAGEEETKGHAEHGRDDPNGSSSIDQTVFFSCAQQLVPQDSTDVEDQTLFLSCVQNQDDHEISNSPKHVHFKSLVDESSAKDNGASAEGQNTAAAPEATHTKSDDESILHSPTRDQDGTTKPAKNPALDSDASDPLQSKEVWHDKQEGAEEQQKHDEYLDLVQILSVILIPTIARAADEDRNGPEPHKTMPVPADDASYFIRKIYYPVMSSMTELGNTHYEKQRPKPKGKAFFDHALSVLLKDSIPSSSSVSSGSSREGPLMTEELVRELLLTHGEVERAENPKLIREMVQAAQSSSGRLDREAFIHAMSSDLTEFKVGSEDKISTFFADVFGDDDPRTITSLYKDRSEIVENDEEAMENADTKTTTTQRCWVNGGIFESERTSIDMVLDSHSSIITHVLIFLFFLLNVLVYGTQLLPDASERECHASDFGCLLGGYVVRWIIVAVVLSTFGMLVVLPLSVGNSPFRRTSLPVMFSLIVSIAYTLIPYFALNWKTYDGINESFAQQFKFFQIMTLASGAALSLSLALHVIVPFVVKLAARCITCVPRFFAFVRASSNVRGESYVKWAATRKVNSLLVNADGLHALGTGPRDRRALMMKKSTKKALRNVTDETMRNYVLNSAQRETVGGFYWTFKNIVNGSLFADEGIWINSRLIVFQTCMVVTAFIFAYILLWSVVEGAEAADNARASLDPSTVPEWLYDMMPTGEMVRKSLYPAAVTGIVVSFVLISIYIPSMVSTALQYRSQVRPSLGSIYFNKYRDATQNVYMNTANAVYGMVGSAALFYLVIGLVVFLFFWPPTKDFMMLLLAWCLGLTITVVLKMILTSFCRSNQYRSFYRIRPRAARLSSLALECWFVGLGGSVLLGRICQFLFAAVFWIGRIDAPFLDEDVSLFGYSFDYVPTFFIQDVLVHDAHRHPYIERLSQMYLMKLHHRDRFVSHAGAAWRQLFVVSFFPWLARYRVFHDERYAEAMEDLDERQKQEQEAEQQTNVAVGKAGLRLVLETVDDVIDDVLDDVIGVSTDTGEHQDDGGRGRGRNEMDDEGSETKWRVSI